MATVPGTPEAQQVVETLPQELRPRPIDLHMAAELMKQERPVQVAGEVVPFQRKPLDLTGKDLDEYKKMMTRDTLSRALGGTSNVTPLKPEDK